MVFVTGLSKTGRELAVRGLTMSSGLSKYMNIDKKLEKLSG